mmetsp:Transcript_15045/g.13503  ORF Transcript_15045/g.13503 Transcript_15045/m.13503 type:complete len:156 (-) Transcript_15045:159-626(-)
MNRKYNKKKKKNNINHHQQHHMTHYNNNNIMYQQNPFIVTKLDEIMGEIKKLNNRLGSVQGEVKKLYKNTNSKLDKLYAQNRTVLAEFYNDTSADENKTNNGSDFDISGLDPDDPKHSPTQFMAERDRQTARKYLLEEIRGRISNTKVDDESNND